MKCRLCGTEINHPFFVYDNMAQDVAVLYQKKTVMKGKNTPIYRCPQCGLFQIPFGEVSDNYYLMSASQSDKMNRLQEDEVKQIKELAPDSKSILEVGCGDGNFLAIAKKYFDQCVGIEPQEVFIDEQQKKGLEVIREYLGYDTILPQQYDAVVARQTFEHIDNPQEVFSSMARVCADDGILMIEIPNGEKSIRENRYFDFFSDHVNHWTVDALVYMAEANGMHVVRVEEGFGGDYLQLFARKNVKEKYSFADQIPADVERIKNIIASHENTAVYGAGAKAQVIFLQGGEELRKISHIYDSDTKKAGLYLANADIPVTAPDKNIGSLDAVIIFAKSYADEICEQLTTEFGFKGDVFII